MTSSTADEQKGRNRMMRLHAIISVIFLGVVSVTTQTPKSQGKPTEQVVVHFEKLVANGAFLTPQGWKMAGALFAQWGPFPRAGEVSLTTVGGSVGETRVSDDQAQVETKWTDDLGKIDSTLRFKPPEIRSDMTSYVFHLVYTNKHRDIGANGETIREATGPWEWKIDGPVTTRWATVDRAIEYVEQMRDESDDPMIRQNADKTIAALKRLRTGCGNASAC
jgi:hypothetical protein